MDRLYPFLRRGLQQVLKHGPSLLYWRYVKRKEILDAAPVECPPDARIEVHTLVCERDWLNAFWTLYSFHYFSGVPFRLVVLHDGWLEGREDVRQAFECSFPGAIVEDRDALASRVESEVGSPLSEMWMSGDYPTLAKVIDSVLLAQGERVIFLDPDVLFFATPRELLEGARSLDDVSARWNLPTRDINLNTLYSCRYTDLNKSLEKEVPKKFQIGLGVYRVQSVDFEMVNRLLREIKEIRAGMPFMIDQTIFGVLAAKYDYRPLSPDRYAVDPVENLNGVVARHYHSTTRDLMYVEGIPTVIDDII